MTHTEPYQHYYQTTALIPEDTFNKIVKDFKKIVKEAPQTTSPFSKYPNEKLEITQIDGRRKPIINRHVIEFGAAAKWRDPSNKSTLRNEHYLPMDDGIFRLSQAGNPVGKQLCRTDGKPYDLLVCAALIIADHHHKGFMFTSDGCATDPIWMEAYEFCHIILGYSYPSLHNLKPITQQDYRISKTPDELDNIAAAFVKKRSGIPLRLYTGCYSDEPYDIYLRIQLDDEWDEQMYDKFMDWQHNQPADQRLLMNASEDFINRDILFQQLFTHPISLKSQTVTIQFDKERQLFYIEVEFNDIPAA